MKKTTCVILRGKTKSLGGVLLLLMTLFLGHVVFGQTTGTIQIGSGTDTGSGGTTIPVTNYNYSYSQQIVTAAEYALGEGVAGPITKIRYYVTSIGTMSVWNNWTVYLGNTTKTSFSSATDWVPLADLTQVFSGTITATNNNWFEITLSTPFNYTGGNIIVAVDENAPGWSSAPTFRMYTSAANTGILYRDDTTNPNPATPPTATSRQSKLPQIQFVGNLASCLSPTNVTISNITQVTATVGWTASVSSPSQGYIWEVRTDTNPGTAGAVTSGTVAAGVTTTPVTGLQPNTLYNVYVRSNCGAGDTSNWSIVKTFTTLCTSDNIPYVMPINATTGTNLPSCVTRQDVNNDGKTWVSTTAQAGITGRVMSYPYHSTNAANDWFYTNALNLTGGQSYRLKFKAKISSNSYPESLKVAYGNMNDFNAMTTVLYDQTINNTTVVSQVIDFTPALTGTYYIGFQAKSAPDMSTLYVGEISVDLSPSCLVPENVQITNITKNSATISWTAPAQAPDNGYEYQIRTSGTPADGATGLAQTGTTAAGVVTKNIISLNPSTEYFVYVRSVCDPSNLSAWTLVKTFKTLCNHPDLVSTTPGSVCGIGTVDLAAQYSEGTVQWFTSASGGGAIHSGTTFTTPELSATTSYWVSANAGGQTIVGGKSTPGTSGTTPFVYGLVFNATEAFTLTSVDVFLNSSSAGNLVIRLTNSAGTTLQELTIAVPAGSSSTPLQYTLPLNLSIPVGTGYRLLAISGPSMIRDFSETGYPYNLGTAGAITSGFISSSTLTTYYYFYNWNIATGCSSPRTEVVATVTPAPALALSTTAPAAICEGTSTPAVTITAGASDYTTYNWEPATGVSGDAATGWVFNPSETTAYELTATTASGCTEKIEVLVQVNPLPGFTPLEESYVVCADAVQELNTNVFLGSEVIVGTATTKTADFDAQTAFMNRWSNTRQQYVYTKDELNALGFTAGTIQGLAFEVATLGSSATNADYTVKMKQVTNSTVTSTTFVDSDFITVYGPVSHTHTATGWQTINFTTPFVWDGNSNILIELTHKGANSSNNAQTYYTETAENTEWLIRRCSK